MTDLNHVPEPADEVYNYLTSIGKTEDEAADIVVELLLDAKALEDQVLAFGYNSKIAAMMGRLKVERYIDNVDSHKLNYGKMYSLIYIENASNIAFNRPWSELTSDEQIELTWNLGLDSKQFKLYRDVGCINEDERQICGEYIYCSERTDKAWEKSGHASDDVRYRKDRAVLAGFRNDKDWDTIASAHVASKSKGLHISEKIAREV